MARLKRLVKTSQLKTNLWKERVGKKEFKSNIYYNETVDSLSLLIVPPTTKKIVHYIDDHVALYYEPESLEVIGVRVEAFERSFLPKYAELKKAWCLSDTGKQLHDFYDLLIAVEYRQPQIATEITKIAGGLLLSKGLKLEPVTA